MGIRVGAWEWEKVGSESQVQSTNFVEEAGESVNERVRKKAEFEVGMTLHTLGNRKDVRIA